MLQRTNPRTLWILLYLWGSYLLTRLFADFSSLTAYPTMSLSAMVNGTAVRPFVSRALVPIVIRWMDAHTSDFLQYQLMNAAGSRGFATEFYVHGYTFEKAVLLALTFFFYLGTALILRALAREYYALGESAAWAAGLLSLAFIPALFTYYSHIYDPPTIFFAAAMLLACRRGQPVAFGVLFLIASVNRETAVLYLPVYLAMEWMRLRARGVWGAKLRGAAHVAYALLLAAAWFYIRYRINLRYAHNRGGVLDFQLFDHNLRLFSVAPLAAAWSLFIALIVILLVASEWRAKPAQLRWSLLLVFAPLAVGSLLCGYVEELRVYFELYPMLYLLALPSALRVLGLPLAEQNEGGA